MDPQQENQNAPQSTATAEPPAAPAPAPAGPSAPTTPPVQPTAAKPAGSGNKMWLMILGAVIVVAIIVYFLTK